MRIATMLFAPIVLFACGGSPSTPAASTPSATSSSSSALTSKAKVPDDTPSDKGSPPNAKVPPENPTPEKTTEKTPAVAASSSASSAPPMGASPTTKDGKPFAGSTGEATEMISSAVDTRHSQISACVRSFRVRKKMEHKRVAVSFGIDQDGKLLGVTSKGKEDNELKGCVQEALKGAPFPRSHAGVITVTKSYEDILVQPHD